MWFHCYFRSSDKSVLLSRILVIMTLLSLIGCKEKTETLFTLLPSSETGVTFTNTVEENNALNILTYEYLYNGGGVASGDFNNDGWIDLFFTGNKVENKLYLNKGNLTFEDITVTAGVKGKAPWKTGVALADVNEDGLLDIYISTSGPGNEQEHCNELYINQGGKIPKFKEEASKYNLDACGTYSTQASFFDYDKDGDLDMFLLNHARLTYNPFFNTRKLRSLRHAQYGNRLYRNDTGKFTDVSELAGIHGSGVNFGLGISISDVNGDTWPDLYVTNDYEEQDFFYLNHRDGTFREVLKKSFRHISRNGMGSDIADYNNDGLPDVMVVDMLPEGNYRQKVLKGPDEYDKYNLLRDSGYHHQNMRNTLQLNLGNSPDSTPTFSEVGQLAGVSNTDWSWSPLFADFDNDGLKDILITNGFLRDFTNLDFVKYKYGDNAKGNKSNALLEIVKELPSTRITNYVFNNRGDLTFDNTTEKWGLTEKSISNGAVYADLDNDGDLDIIINNINQEAFIYRNNSDKNNHYIKITLQGNKTNPFAVGSKIRITTERSQQMQELYLSRGFQSSVSPISNFGLGKEEVIKEINVEWPDGKISSILNLPADISLTLNIKDATLQKSNSPVVPTTEIFQNISASSNITFTHHENEFIDYKVQYLLPYQVSRYGPCLTTSDINHDGNEDFFIGGASGQSGKLFLMNNENSFQQSVSQPWSKDSLKEDTGAVFFDADGDQDLDLYVVSGGSEFKPSQADLLQDRLYLNNGKGVFQEDFNALPKEFSNGSCVVTADYDKDGDLDLFVGARSIPGNYPLPSHCFLLRNDTQNGNVRFSNVTPTSLLKPGIVSSVIWTDYNNDSWPDLIIAGEFMPVMLFKNSKGLLIDQTIESGLANTNGMWCTLIEADTDDDGDKDIIAGNIGLNTSFKASEKEPLVIYSGDFNADGIIDPIVSTYIGHVQYPLASRDEMLEQLPYLKKIFSSYDAYASASIQNILTEEKLKNAIQSKAYILSSAVFENKGNGTFSVSSLPMEAQFTSSSGILFEDLDSDGKKDILLAGNFYPQRVQQGRSDAGSGLLLKGNGKGNFTPIMPRRSGFYAPGDVRSLCLLRNKKGERYVLVGLNDDKPIYFKN
ncbi:MAG: VCBS repeat-containing protein, partial [Chryseolinea sp.]